MGHLVIIIGCVILMVWLVSWFGIFGVIPAAWVAKQAVRAFTEMRMQK